ncbi:hypothetical protein Z043_117834 [Scleropages formosus]|uniref:Uncharacterized protein n=1 Tax=Scleropages formosus TaxID=113540 RepID=A0A0P7UPS0_SCLFO|nr:hypothetical protein Z043_117834 [Scleropages formosus]
MSQRGQTRANGPTTLSESGEGREAQPGRGDQARAVVVPSDSRAGAQARAPRFSALSTSSSGYHSLDYDSLPSSPLMTDNKATQTPSPSSQAIAHAQERISRAHDALPDDGKSSAAVRSRALLCMALRVCRCTEVCGNVMPGVP